MHVMLITFGSLFLSVKQTHPYDLVSTICCLIVSKVVCNTNVQFTLAKPEFTISILASKIQIFDSLEMEHRQWCSTKEGCPIKRYKRQAVQVSTDSFSLLNGTPSSLVHFFSGLYHRSQISARRPTKEYLASIYGNGFHNTLSQPRSKFHSCQVAIILLTNMY